MLYLKQSTAAQSVLIGPFVDATDGVTAETGLTIANTDIRLSANGGNMFAKTSGGGTHDEEGFYSITLDATDTATVGKLQLSVQDAAHLPVYHEFWVLEEAIYDSLFGASAAGFDSNQRVDVGAVLGTAQTAGDIPALVTTVDTVVDGIQTDLDNGTDGLGAIKTETAAILADTAVIGAAGAGLTAIPWNAAWDAEVESEVNDGLVALGLDHLVGAAVIGTDVVDNSIVAKLVSSSATADWDDFVNTTDALQALRDRGDAAWTTGAGGIPPTTLQNTTIAAYTSQTSFTLTAGSADDDAYNGMLCIVTDQSTSTQKAVGIVSDYTGSTKTVTLREDPLAGFTFANGDTIDIVAQSQDILNILDDTDLIDDGTSGLAKIATDVAAILVDTGTTIPATITTIDDELAIVDTVVDGIQTDLDNATDGLGALKALIDTVDTVVDGIKTVTDSLTDIDTVADAVWDEVLTGATHNVLNSAGRRLRQIDAAFEVHSGTAQAGAAGTITLDTGASATDDIYNGDRIIITEGTGAQEHGIVLDYDGTTKVATMAENWVVTPDATSVFEVVPADVDVESVNHTGQTSGDLAALITTLDTVADGIQTDLDNGTDGLGALKTLVDTVDTVVDAIKVVTDALPDAGALTTLQADTDDIQTRLPAALVSGKMDSDMTAISGDTTAADRLEALMDGALICQVNDASATPTAFAADGFTEATDDHFNGRLITFISGALSGQQTDCTDYDAAGHVQGSQTFVVTALTEAPANNDFFVVH